VRAPDKFVQYLSDSLYHPRSDAHSNALCLAILDDLLEHCTPLGDRAARGEIVAKLNHNVIVGHDEWNIDLAIGPAAAPSPPPAERKIRMEPPAVVEIAVEAKAVMTEHGKARLNRVRDLRAFHSHAHLYNDKVIAVAVVAVNVAQHFWSPTRAPDDISRHGPTVGAKTVTVFRNLPLRNAHTDPPGLEAVAMIVIHHDNLKKNPHPFPEMPTPTPTSLITAAPAPQPGEPMHYATMITRVCRAYRERWL
jgi:hypothetical protein